MIGFSDGQGRMQVQKFSFASFSFPKEKDVPSRGMSGPKHIVYTLSMIYPYLNFTQKKPIKKTSDKFFKATWAFKISLYLFAKGI